MRMSTAVASPSNCVDRFGAHSGYNGVEVAVDAAAETSTGLGLINAQIDRDLR